MSSASPSQKNVVASVQDATQAIVDFMVRVRRVCTGASKTGMKRGPVVATTTAATASVCGRASHTKAQISKLQSTLERLNNVTGSLQKDLGQIKQHESKQ